MFFNEGIFVMCMLVMLGMCVCMCVCTGVNKWHFGGLASLGARITGMILAFIHSTFEKCLKLYIPCQKITS